MCKKNIISSIFLLTFILSCKSNNISWQDLENKTIIYDNNFAGTAITFLESNNKNKLAIVQILGSGVPVVSSYIFKVNFSNGTLVFREQVRPIKKNKLFNVTVLTFSYQNEKIQINDYKTLSQHEKPILFTNNRNRKIDIEAIKNHNYENFNLWQKF